MPQILLGRQVERKDLAWERWYDLSSQEIGEMIKAPKYASVRAVPLASHSFSCAPEVARVYQNPKLDLPLLRPGPKWHLALLLPWRMKMNGTF